MLVNDSSMNNIPSLHPKRIPGWWFQPTPLKNMSSSVGNIIPKIKAMFQTTNQSF